MKICGLTRAEDAAFADAAGADYLGTVLSTGFARSVAAAAAATLLEGTTATRVAVLVDEAVGRARELAHAIDAGVIQLHGDESPESVADLRARGDWRVWKAVRARTAKDVTDAVSHYGDLVDGWLVEGWRAGVVGGAGVRLEVDPATLRASVPTDRTFVLAGGLTPASVHAAVARFRPDIVDVSSGVESAPGQKDSDLVLDFVRNARSALDTPAPFHKPRSEPHR